MKTIQCLMLLGLFWCGALQAQVTSPENDSTRYSKYSLYGELGGPGFLSLNVDRLFHLRPLVATTARIGLGLYPYELGMFGGQTRFAAVLPVSHSFLFGNAVAAELGYGLTLGFYEDEDAFGGRGPLKWFHATAGLRYQKPARGFLFRIGYTPLIGSEGICVDTNCLEVERQLQLTHLFGISLGGRLKASTK
ncbi:hypothetical protein [Cesiribacter andamanensis]|uniref:Outer membrane protein beta-barrel domain-containing protein n=1 Tax=Cesiribacter andamanensis AMV16 TaxID=1279009 RepID=M7NSF9_9BACT|nr:hypothetical protein [Cesiribacter andamanensis]EMR01414.1 hypothetical protein ADICEAN_03448 [Cesiribacter andamanensis AMV16]